MTPCAKQPERYVALDVHRDYVVVGAVDAQQEVVLAPRRLSLCTNSAHGLSSICTPATPWSWKP